VSLFHTQVEKVASGVQELRNATVSSLAALSDRNGSELSKVASQGEASAKEAVAAGEAAACAAQAAVSALASALRTQAKQLKAMAAAQAEAVTKAHGAVNNLAGCARSGLQGRKLWMFRARGTCFVCLQQVSALHGHESRIGVQHVVPTGENDTYISWHCRCVQGC
jgi:hypothetical protein